MPQKEKKNNKGLAILIICSILTLGIIIGCIFFPEQIFGIFEK